MVKSTLDASASVVSSMSRARAKVAEASEVGMALTVSPAATRSPRARMAHSVVEPVPNPTIISASMYSAARRPAASFGVMS